MFSLRRRRTGLPFVFSSPSVVAEPHAGRRGACLGRCGLYILLAAGIIITISSIGCGGNGYSPTQPSQSKAPAAVAGGPYTGTAGTAVSFSAVGSSDPAGLSLSYAWTFGDATSGTGVSPTHTYSAAGTYTVVLTVTNSAGVSATASTTATIAAASQPPVANAGGPYTGTAGTAITFNGSGSSDPRGETLTYIWDFGDSSTGSGANPTHTYNSAGTYTVKLTVTNTDKLSATATATATIAAATLTLTASFSPISATVYQGGQQGFTANITGAGGVTLSYQWSTTATAGSLAEVGGAGQTGASFCSPGNQVTYTAAATPALSASVSDTVKVQVYAGAGCSGTANTSATARITVNPSVSATALPGMTTTNFTATVVLPAGSTFTPDALTVLDSVTSTTPTPSGTFTIAQYTGEQIVFVDAPDGTPMMMGWMDANHTTVSASTTAEVLAYYALGGSLMLTKTDRDNAIAQIPQLPGFTALASTVTSELAANPDAFAQSDAKVAAALNSLFTQATGVTPQVKSSRIKPMDTLPTPSATTPQSGLTVSNTEPPAPYFTNSPVTAFSEFLTNAYRRRIHAFVIKQFDTLKGVNTPNGVQTTDFELAPTVGVNGGVTGALTDMIKAYFGTQPTAYAPVTSDPFELAVDNGFDSTTYQVITVGPGGSGAPSPVQLTTGQQAILVSTSISSLVQDQMIPFMTNVLFSDSFFADDQSNSALAGNVRTAFINNLEKNVLTLVTNISSTQGNLATTLQDSIVAGDVKTAMGDLLFNLGGLPAIGDAVKSALNSAASAYGGSAAAGAGATAALNHFNVLMYSAGSVLQAFDTVVYIAQIANSDNVDVWSVKSTPFLAKINPAQSVLNSIGEVSLTATILNVEPNVPVSYLWTLAPSSGQSLLGTLTEVGGSQRVLPDANGSLSFCSSSNKTLYSSSSTAVANLTQIGYDTVTVTGYLNGNCQSANQFSSVGSATIQTNPLGNITLTPSQPTVSAGGAVQFSAEYVNVADQITPGSWSWTLSAGTNPGPNGTLAGDTTGSNYVCTTTPNMTYTSTATSAPNGNLYDLLVVQAYQDSACGTTLPLNNTAAVGLTTIATSSAPLLNVAPSATLQPGQQIQVGAAFVPPLTSGATVPAAGSYLWTNTGSYGTLTGAGSSGNSYCSTSAEQTYTAAANAGITDSVFDQVTATAFADTKCTPSQQEGLMGSAKMNIEPPTGPYVVPGQITSVVQSGDGFFYASASGTCSAANQDTCDWILRIDPQGAVTVLHTFELNTNTTSCLSGIDYLCTNTEGSGVNGIIEAADGNLYGSTTNGGPYGAGTVFKMAKDGTLTALYQFPMTVSASGGFGSTYHRFIFYAGLSYSSPFGDLPGPIIEGLDGDFYGLAADGQNGTGVFFAVSPNRGIAVSNPFAPSAKVDQASVGLNYTNMALVQGLDGNFYTEMTETGLGQPGLMLIDPNGVTGAPLYSFSNSTVPSHTPLIGGPDNALFGMVTGATSSADFELKNGQVSDINSAITPLSLLGSDGNFYGVTANTNSIVQTTQTGASTTVATIQNADTKSAVTTGNATGTMIEASNGNLMSGAVNTNPTTGASVYFLSNTATKGLLQGPIQLSFPDPITLVNKPVKLTWTVSNAFSATYQVCHATVTTAAGAPAPGGGDWSGAQLGEMNGNVYTGSFSIVPTIAGTYTYALTCGGVESGFTSLTVQ